MTITFISHVFLKRALEKVQNKNLLDFTNKNSTFTHMHPVLNWTVGRLAMWRSLTSADLG